MPRPDPVPVELPSHSLPVIKFKKADVDKITKEARKSIAKKMGVAENKLPASVKSAIETATNRALQARAATLVSRDVDMAVKSGLLSGVSSYALLDTRMTAAQQGLAHIVGDTKVDDVLKDTATLLKKKFDAFKDADFTEAQAFELLIAEVKGRASR